MLTMYQFSFGIITKNMHSAREKVPNFVIQQLFDFFIATEKEFGEKVKYNMLKLCNMRFKGYRFKKNNIEKIIRNAPFRIRRYLVRSKKRKWVWNIYQEILNQRESHIL